MTNSEKMTAALEISDEILKTSEDPKLLSAIADVLEYLRLKLENDLDGEMEQQRQSIHDYSTADQLAGQLPMFES